ncbi:TolB family protein [Herbiconiux daphne]|uniref:WD40 repeat protein n=1 Tax=Herbiconiux daphne TaxID=2970914 RepID=A0ABT2H102_9MICO|nr:hypothetical protein [Herbiconiux daphne]MCS5733599.1 hypothetical protein [Herbiconiux daphne]
MTLSKSTRFLAPAAALCAVLTLATGALTAQAAPPPVGTIQLVDVSTTPGVAEADGAWGQTISGDGRYIVFISASPDLPGAFPGHAELYLRDLLSGFTRQIGDTNWIPQQSAPSISDDGSQVAYTALNADVSPYPQAVLWTVDSDGTTLLSDSWENLGHGVNDSVESVDLAAAGGAVAYSTWATDVIASDVTPERTLRVYKQDASGTDIEVAVDGTQWQTGPVISADGRFVAYLSQPTTAPRRWVTAQVNLRDTVLGTTQLISHAYDGSQGADHISMSADARYIAFESSCNCYDGGPEVLGSSVFVHDRVTGKTTAEAVDLAGEFVSNAGWPSLSADGLTLAYATGGQIYLRDRVTYDVRLISKNRVPDVGSGSSHQPVVSADGHFVTWATWATNLTGDTYPSRPVPPTHILVANVG